MSWNALDLYSVGIGPSSSHTLGPMRAATRFVHELKQKTGLSAVEEVTVCLYGSLASTGIGHAIDKAIIMGLESHDPATVDLVAFNNCINRLNKLGQLTLGGEKAIAFVLQDNLIFQPDVILDAHVNAVRFVARNVYGSVMEESLYFSVGGGFVLTEAEISMQSEGQDIRPYPYHSAADLLKMCTSEQKSIAALTRDNEVAHLGEAELSEKLRYIWQYMSASIQHGLKQAGILPGGLNVSRRAKKLAMQLEPLQKGDYGQKMPWLNVYAMAVNEENAASGRMVTAPTNGAAGIIPAVLQYYLETHQDAKDSDIDTFLLTAASIGWLYKHNASISGAEVGCQGEVGVACSMAAAGLTACLGGDIHQVEHAAEMGMEHHLGLTCDPVKGLVQVPCIERNGMAAVRAVNTAEIAMLEQGEHVVSLDRVIRTMYQTGKDMSHTYKETALGGLAVNWIEC